MLSLEKDGSHDETFAVIDVWMFISESNNINGLFTCVKPRINLQGTSMLQSVIHASRIFKPFTTTNFILTLLQFDAKK